MFSRGIPLAIFLAAFLANIAAEPPALPYKVFYLGLEPKAKHAIISDMLSAGGKIYWVDSHSVLVRDETEVLAAIAKLLEKDDFALQPQVMISLRRQGAGESSASSHDIGVQVSRERGVGVSVQASSGKNTFSESGETSIAVVSGGTGEIALTVSETVLAAYRGRFIEVRPGERVRDGVVLAVSPIVTGKRVHVRIETRYWASVKGDRRSFKTGEIATAVVLAPGRWTSIGGSSGSRTDETRGGIILSRSDEQGVENLDFALKAEIIELH